MGTLGSQLGIRKQLISAYQLATGEAAYTYLLVDYSDRGNVKAWRWALRSNIFPDDPGHTTVYGSPSAEGEELLLASEFPTVPTNYANLGRISTFRHFFSD